MPWNTFLRPTIVTQPGKCDWIRALTTFSMALADISLLWALRMSAWLSTSMDTRLVIKVPNVNELSLDSVGSYGSEEVDSRTVTSSLSQAI